MAHEIKLNAERTNWDQVTSSNKDWPWFRLAHLIQGLWLTFRATYITRHVALNELTHPVGFTSQEEEEIKAEHAKIVREAAAQRQQELPVPLEEGEEMDGEFVDDMDSAPMTLNDTLSEVIKTWRAQMINLNQCDLNVTKEYLKARCSGTIDQYVLQYTARAQEHANGHTLNDISSKDYGLIFIPVVFQPGSMPGSRGHIALITVTPVLKTIDYYDSFGITIADREEHAVSGQSLKQILTDVANKYFPNEEVTITENRERHQTDFFSCPFHVADRVDQLANNPQYNFKPPTFEEITGERRITIHNQVMQWVNTQPYDQRLNAADPTQN